MVLSPGCLTQSSAHVDAYYAFEFKSNALFGVFAFKSNGLLGEVPELD